MIRKALIPIAGLGTRLYPLTKVVPKALLPLPAGGDRVLPIVHLVCAEAAAAGVEQVLLVVSPAQLEAVQSYFAAVDLAAPALPNNIEFAVQATPQGFGDAVLQGAGFVGDDAFLVLLGDHVYAAGPKSPSCAAQVARAYAKYGGVALVAVQPVAAEELSRVGVPRGLLLADRAYRCVDFVEKPDPTTAQDRLVTEGLGAGEYLAHSGIYVFGGEILDCLKELSDRAKSGEAELELAAAQSMLLERHPEDYYLYRIDGKAYDTGTMENYIKAFTALANQ